MSRYYHFLACIDDLLLLKSTGWHLSDFPSSNWTLIDSGRSRQWRILLRSLARNKGNIFQLNPLHHCASVGFSHRHGSTWRHRMMRYCWVCLNSRCWLWRMRRLLRSTKLDDFLWQYLSLILNTLRRLIIARCFCFGGITDCLVCSSCLHPSSGEHRTCRLLLRVFICVLTCHHVVQISLCFCY